MNINLLQAMAAIVLIALAGIGWSGYYNEFQNRIKLEEKVKRLYGE